MCLTIVRQTSISKTSMSKTSISKTSISQTNMSKTGITKTSIGKTSISGMVDDWWVVDQRGWGSKDSCGSTNDCWVSFTLLPVSSGGGSSFKSSSMSSLSLGNLWGVHRSNKRLRVEGWSNQWFWVEGGSNKRFRVEGGSNQWFWVEGRKTRVSNTESSTIGDVFNSLELTVGINIRVSAGNSSVGVSSLLLGRVQVRISIVQVSELILSLELAAWNIRSCIWGNIWSSSDSWGSSIWQTSIGTIRILCSNAADNGRKGDL